MTLSRAAEERTLIYGRNIRDILAFWELLHHGRRAGKEEKREIRVVSGETNLIPHIDAYQL